MRTLNGQESSILAIIAQCPNLDEAQINKLLKSLQDDSLLIALVMLNRVKKILVKNLKWLLMDLFLRQKI
jgi:hypothetical protein